LTTIGEYAFRYCSELQNISIPDSIESISKNAFSDCPKLVYNEFKDAKYLGNASNPYVALIAIKEDSITKIEINEATKIIAQSAFQKCEKLENVVLPSGLRVIEDGAFKDCRCLSSVIIPNSVIYIGDSAFTSSLPGLNILFYTGTEEEWNKIDRSKNWLANANGESNLQIVYNYSA
jgi:hypothetical protein